MCSDFEEVKRRMLVAAAKAAGTLIRKEELRRQVLAAKVNRPLAEALLKEIDNVLRGAPDFEKELKEAVDESLREGKPILETVIDRGLKTIIRSLPLTLTGVIDRMVGILNDINKLIDVVNDIIEDLGRQGIHITKLDRLEAKERDLMSLTSSLRLGRQRLKTIIEFFKEMEKYE